nr:PREDICTED: extracellular signal-regulated kinase 2 [Bemisia tabaci]
MIMSSSFVKSSVCNVDLHIVQKYDLKRRIGKGAYGIVWKAFERKNKTPVAVKKIYDAFRNPTDAQRTFREIAYLQEFRNHPNIVKLLNVHRANNNTDIYLVFEYVETDLHKCIKREKILQDIHKRFIIYQLLKALKYIHSGNVIHRDLKPPNILINSQCHCKIADFGLARSVAPNQNEDEPVLKAMLTDYIATRWYRAPEVLAASKTYSKSIDMWSVGCILGEMLLGKPLFPGSSTVNQLELIINTLGPVSPNDVDSVCSGYGSSLLKQAPPPSKVTSLSSLLPTVSADALDLLNRFLTLNPNHRITAADALEHSYVQMFSEPLGETSLGHSVILPVRDDVRLSIDYYRNKINDAISQNEERQARKIRSCSSDPCVNKKSLEPLLSNVYSTMQYENATSHKSTSKKRQAGYLHCLTNNLTAADIQPLKHPATHPPHRTSKLGHLKHSSDGEASLKSLKSKSLPPPTDSILPAMERTPNQAAFLKNLGKTYLTSIQEYASMTGISQAALAKSENKLNEKLLLPKTKSLSRAKSLCPVYRHPLEGKKSNVDENVAADRSQIKSCNFKRGVHVTSLQKNISSLPVQVSRKKMSSTVLYPYLNPAVTSFKLPADIQNYNLLLSKNGG